MRMHTRLLAVALLLLGAAGCYAPDVRDCAVTCTEPTDCVDDQVCTAQGYCAAEGVTCMRGGGATPDAGPTPPPQMVQLRVRVDGTGVLAIEGVGQCDDSECTWQVPQRPLRAQAVIVDAHKPFERWTTSNCAGQPTVCMFTPAPFSTVGVKFK